MVRNCGYNETNIGSEFVSKIDVLRKTYYILGCITKNVLHQILIIIVESEKLNSFEVNVNDSRRKSYC